MEKREAMEVHDGVCKYATGSLRTSLLRKTADKRVTACGGPKVGKIAVCGYSFKNKKGKTVTVRRHCRKMPGRGKSKTDKS